MTDIREQIKWLGKEAQRHSQSAGDPEFTSRRRSTFKHRAKRLRSTAKSLEKLLVVYKAAKVIEKLRACGTFTQFNDLREAIAAVEALDEKWQSDG